MFGVGRKLYPSKPWTYNAFNKPLSTTHFMSSYREKNVTQLVVPWPITYFKIVKLFPLKIEIYLHDTYLEFLNKPLQKRPSPLRSLIHDPWYLFEVFLYWIPISTIRKSYWVIYLPRMNLLPSKIILFLESHKPHKTKQGRAL